MQPEAGSIPDPEKQNRPMPRTHTRWMLVVSWMALSCVASPNNDVTPGMEGAPGVKTFLVCAPNTVLALPAELQSDTAILRETIETYLGEHGREVEWVDLFEAKRLWTAALAEAREQGEIAKTTAIFARHLAEQRDFQAIVMPSVFVHHVRTSYSSAQWDGVQRNMRTLGAPARPSGRAQDALADGIAYGGISGDMAVSSLHVLVYSRTGERVFEGRGGIEFLHDVDMSAVVRTYRYELRLREDILTDAAVLHEAVGLAFAPYLPLRGS
jgi:hypothetical protein